MERMLEETLDAGCAGMSIRPPSWTRWMATAPESAAAIDFSTWWEFKRLFKILRPRGAMLQGADAIKSECAWFPVADPWFVP